MSQTWLKPPRVLRFVGRWSKYFQNWWENLRETPSLGLFPSQFPADFSKPFDNHVWWWNQTPNFEASHFLYFGWLFHRCFSVQLFNSLTFFPYIFMVKAPCFTIFWWWNHHQPHFFEGETKSFSIFERRTIHFPPSFDGESSVFRRFWCQKMSSSCSLSFHICHQFWWLNHSSAILFRAKNRVQFLRRH